MMLGISTEHIMFMFFFGGEQTEYVFAKSLGHQNWVSLFFHSKQSHTCVPSKKEHTEICQLDRSRRNETKGPHFLLAGCLNHFSAHSKQLLQKPAANPGKSLGLALQSQTNFIHSTPKKTIDKHMALNHGLFQILRILAFKLV